ncbi:glycoside hydrolase family protein [Salix suchowensis]|nr:glycoside hydrolase family protein [Salix suchowensis]
MARTDSLGARQVSNNVPFRYDDVCGGAGGVGGGGRAGGVPLDWARCCPSKTRRRDYQHSSSVYMLPPETVESFFVLWKTTEDVKWRERGWAVFEALEKHARVQNGYASVHDVDEIPAVPNDDMPRRVQIPSRSFSIQRIRNLLAGTIPFVFALQLFPCRNAQVPVPPLRRNGYRAPGQVGVQYRGPSTAGLYVVPVGADGI